MEQQTTFLPFSVIPLMIWLMGILFFVIAMLVFRFAMNLKWLKAICFSVFAATIILILLLRVYPGSSPEIGIGVVFLLPAVVCGVIMIIEFFQRVISSGDSSVNAAERDRILRMVEDGKIDTEEARGLLDAMGRADAFMGQDKFSRLDILMLVGVALVVLGFFLPWAYIRMEQLPASTTFGSTDVAPSVHIRLRARNSGYQAGYHLGAIGWAVLIVGIASAIPIFVTPKDFLYKISMMQIFLNIIGIVLVVSLLFQIGNRVGVGLIMCLVGFIIGIFATASKFKKLAA